MINNLLSSSKKNLTQSVSGSVSLAIGFIFVFLLALVSGFFLTHEEAPYTSELAFIEKSGDSNIKGSVIPASCESNPPEDHVPGDCGCSINAISPCSGASCTRTIRWAANVASGQVNIWRGATYIGERLANSEENLTVAVGGETFSVMRNDGIVLCSTFVTGYPAPTLTFTANGASDITVNQTDTVTLSWTVENADTCAASGSWVGGQIANNGTHEAGVVPTSPSNSYTLNCSGPGGSTPVQSVSVTVRPPSVTLDATPPLIGPGMSSTLFWTVSGASTCDISGGWNGPITPANGNMIVSPSYAPVTSYTLTCIGIGGDDTKSTTITMPSGTITATPCTISPDESSCFSTVSWNSANFIGARSVQQNSSVFSVSPSDSVVRTVNPDNDLFKLEDTGSSFVRIAEAGAVCHTGSVWVTEAQLCISLPVLTLDSDKIVRSGTSAGLDIAVRANYLTTCTVQDGTTQTFTHSASSIARSYNMTTRTLKSAQIVTLTCTHNTYPIVTQSKQVRIEVIPTIQEI